MGISFQIEKIFNLIMMMEYKIKNIFTGRRLTTFQSTVRRKFFLLKCKCTKWKMVPKCPIGIPKVPYRNTKNKIWQWIEIWDALYRERIIFIGQAINEDMANNLVATILYLDSVNNNDIKININCTGGEVSPSLALLDTMRYIKSDVLSIGFGSCMGMAGFLLSMGHKGKRFALYNTRLMLHHPTGTVRGQVSGIYREACELMKIRNRMDQLIAEQSGQPVEKIAYDLRRNMFMTTEHAIEYGIIDCVIKSTKNITSCLVDKGSRYTLNSIFVEK